MLDGLKLRPSSSSRWLSCTSSLALNQNSTSSKEANIGTAIHEVGERLLNGGECVAGETIGNIVIDDDMVNVAYSYVNYIKYNVLGGEWLNDLSEVEGKVSLTHLLPINSLQLSDEFGGTADFIHYDDDTSALHIVDLKSGRIEVYAKGNTQLMLYAIGAFREFESYGFDVKNIHLHIVQDAIGNTNSHVISIMDLLAFEIHVKNVIDRIANDDVSYIPNESNCKYCQHKNECPVLLEKMFEMCDMVEDIETMHIDSIEKLLLSKTLIIDTLNNYHEHVLSNLKMDGTSDLFEVKDVRGRLLFKDSKKAIDTMSRWNGISKVDITNPATPRTPKQILKHMESLGSVSTRRQNQFDALLADRVINQTLKKK